MIYIERNYNEELMDAVAYSNLLKVKKCLENGANPNYYRPVENNGSDDSFQPTTPLKLVMFRISDCMLEDSHLEQFAEIAKLLIAHGADPQPAMVIAEERYGKYDPKADTGPFMNVWHIIANAMHHF